MNIAQVAPLFEAVPPKSYGGTERVVHYLTEALVRQGHNVTLFASGDSRTSARLVAGSVQRLGLNVSCFDAVLHQTYLLEQVMQMAEEFDVIHYHLDIQHQPLASRMAVASITTLHNRLDQPPMSLVYRDFPQAALVSISDDQRRPMPKANWIGTVYHGLPLDLYPASAGPGRYLAFLGRMSPEKRPDRAIEIAIRSGLPLRMAAKIDARDRPYFENVIQPLLAHPLIEFIGEIGEGQKAEFLGHASALLFPIDWPEPFGLVMIEALACGTPVIAYRRGSVPEVIEDGVTGFLVNDEDEAVRAVQCISQLSRARCRTSFEERFSDDRMARNYFRAYQTITEQAREAYLQRA